MLNDHGVVRSAALSVYDAYILCSFCNKFSET